jgi:hypothetical protein
MLVIGTWEIQVQGVDTWGTYEENVVVLGDVIRDDILPGQ